MTGFECPVRVAICPWLCTSHNLIFIETLLRLLGRHGHLGLDSWSRKKVAELRFRGRPAKDARVARLYAPFGRFAGLAFWMDVTREWHEGAEGLWP